MQKHVREITLKGDKQNYPNKPTKLSEKQRLYRMWLPYGKWICSDEREVLFNREYEPIWERSVNNLQTLRSDPNEHIQNIVEEHFYYDDGCPPHVNKQTLQTCLCALDDFGVVDTHIPDEYI